ncbi:MAG: ethanolamine permease [Planctomycetota bacterium]|nr:ethanolamine permease [Planctomycetota bacterium]
MAKHVAGVAGYENVDASYLQDRKLKPSAGWILLWALGVGAVISGDYGGWNGGLLAGGFWGLAVATFAMAIMYVCMVLSIAELSSALPHAGGFYSFTRNALGPTGGFICGVTDTIEYVLTPAVIVYYIGGYLNALLPLVPVETWWVLAYALFVTINILGAQLTLRFGLIMTVLAIAVLVFFYLAVLSSGSFDASLLAVKDQPASLGEVFNGGWASVFAALPFAIWFYLAIEQLPLAAEETHDVVRDMPRALILGIVTLLVLSLFTMVLNSGVGGGAEAMGKSDAPLSDGFKAIFGEGLTTQAFTLIALTGLIASFHTIIYAYGRVLFALSRAGYFPRWISKTSRFQTPHRALLLGAAVGLGCIFMISGLDRIVPANWLGDAPVAERQTKIAGTLLYMAVFGAVISYCMVMISYIKLKITQPDLPRPYRSPLGIPGAALGAGLSLLALIACFFTPDYRPAVVGVSVFLLVSMLYFFLYSRHHLVAQAPEEEVALMAEATRELE